MREAVRLAYLDALGVPNWVPRRALIKAAPRSPAVLDPLPIAEPVPAAPVVAAPAPRMQEAGAPDNRSLEAEAVRAAVSPPRDQVLAQSTREVAISTPIQPAIAPFYLQLWQAGSCALLLQLDEPGLAPGTPAQRLLNDILRAAELPTPRLLADFRWPLIRNQTDRSASAASQGLQAFVQARLEQQAVASIGCFGVMATLLVEGDADQARSLFGREESVEGLPPVWFSADLEELMKEPQAKARLWTLIKRVKSRWIPGQP